MGGKERVSSKGPAALGRNDVRAEHLLWWIFACVAPVTLILLTGGLVASKFATDWAILTWLVASMSLYWVLNRILHSVAEAAGETERDGIIWILPLALGVIPAAVFVASNAPETRIVTCLLWGSFLPALLVQVIRPELPRDSTPAYLEQSGLAAGIRSLFKYRLRVCLPAVSRGAGSRSRRRLSVSTAIFYLGFTAGAAVLIAVRRLIDAMDPATTGDLGPLYGLLGAYAVGVISFGAAIVRLIEATYNIKQGPTGWPVQDEERHVLAALFASSAINMMAASAVWFAIPLVLLIADKLAAG